MAAAVAEAYRVVRAGGQVLDLHPWPEAPRLEAWPAGAEDQRRVVGPLELDPADQADFAAASAALPAGQTRFFEYRYFFDTLDDLTDYLDDNPEFARASDALLERAALLGDRSVAPPVYVIIQRVAITALVKK